MAGPVDSVAHDQRGSVPQGQRVTDIWNTVDTETIDELTDYVGYHNEFLKLFGFGVDGVDYDDDVSPVVEINNLG